MSAGARSSVPFLSWLDAPPPGRAVWFAAEASDDWHPFPYDRLAALCRSAAGRLREAGAGPGDVVPIVCPVSPDFIAAFFGTLLVGATPSPVAPPTAFQDPTAYGVHVRRIATLVGARVLATVPACRDATVAALDGTGCHAVDGFGEMSADEHAATEPPRIGVIQFSSGSTGAPRGARVPVEAIVTNIDAIARWLDYTTDDRFASWLPMHHDMGLVGGLLFPLANRSELYLMRPEQFIRSPVRWLRCFDRGGATSTTVPAFGLAHLLRRLVREDPAGIDLRDWRTLIVGAERIDARVTDRVASALAPYGFDRRAVLPAYGLAEATLAVTGRHHGDNLVTLAVDATALTPGEPIRRSADDNVNTARLVGCGTPLHNVGVRVVDEAGGEVADGVLGEIEVRGPSVAEGYIDDPGTAFGAVLRTGDAGFVHDGQLFVVGRLGDGLKQFGSWLFAEDVQHVAASLSPRPRRTAALLGTLDGRAAAVVVVEGEPGPAAAEIGRAVARRIIDGRVLVAAVPTGWIRSTTSGKPMRRAMWREFTRADFAGAVRWDSGSVDRARLVTADVDDPRGREGAAQ